MSSPEELIHQQLNEEKHTGDKMATKPIRRVSLNDEGAFFDFYHQMLKLIHIEDGTRQQIEKELRGIMDGTLELPTTERRGQLLNYFSPVKKMPSHKHLYADFAVMFNDVVYRRATPLEQTSGANSPLISESFFSNVAEPSPAFSSQNVPVSSVKHSSTL